MFFGEIRDIKTHLFLILAIDYFYFENRLYYPKTPNMIDVKSIAENKEDYIKALDKRHFEAEPLLNKAVELDEIDGNYKLKKMRHQRK